MAVVLAQIEGRFRTPENCGSDSVRCRSRGGLGSRDDI